MVSSVAGPAFSFAFFNSDASLQFAFTYRSERCDSSNHVRLIDSTAVIPVLRKGREVEAELYHLLYYLLDSYLLPIRRLRDATLTRRIELNAVRSKP